MNEVELAQYKILCDRPVFLGGHPKSGTSLLRALLDSHPQLVVYPEETVFFRRFLPQSAGLDFPAKLNLAEKTLTHIFTWERENQPANQEGYPDRDYSAIPFDEVNKAMVDILDGAGCRHDGDILSTAVLGFGKVSGSWQPSARYWVEKSPYNEYYADQIFTWWPEARCIYIVRDPRDNHASYHRKHPDWCAEFFTTNWKRSVNACWQNVARYGEKRCRLIRYEDLVQKTQETLKQLTDFLDIESNPTLAQPTRAGASWKGNSMFADQFSAISTTPLGRWKETLDPIEAAVIEIMAAPQMKALEYEKQSAYSPASLWRAYTWRIRRKFTSRKTGKR
ncbi:MAG: sulfotransferase [Anaerolineales bacterium]|nr:sulfotransferase [Anaerolineales bacterium]